MHSLSATLTIWLERQDSNLQPTVPKTVALPIELLSNTGGSGGIRTHGTLLTFDGFQDRCDRPLCHASYNPRTMSFVTWFQSRLGETGRSSRIRTYDLSLPKRTHCQAVLYSVIWHRCKESNLGLQFWRLMCYRNTSPTFFYEYTPSLSDLLLSAIHTAECTHKKSP